MHRQTKQGNKMKKKSNKIQLNLSLSEKVRREQEIELYGKLLSLRPCKVHILKNKYNRRKAKAEMRKLMVSLGFVFATMLMTSCHQVHLRGYSIKDIEPTETNKLDSLYKHSVVYDELGHEYDLYENGWKYSDSYAFELVHKADCKKCYEMFD